LPYKLFDRAGKNNCGGIVMAKKITYSIIERDGKITLYLNGDMSKAQDLRYLKTEADKIVLVEHWRALMKLYEYREIGSIFTLPDVQYKTREEVEGK
jgi:uncharacterized membrane protein YcaP (DUF421 family)